MNDLNFNPSGDTESGQSGAETLVHAEGTLVQEHKFRKRFSQHRSRGALLFGTSLAVMVFATIVVPSQSKKTPPSREAIALFESKIRPVLDAKCVACHGPKQQIAGLRLDQAISEKMAQKVAQVITYTSSIKMPPSGKLPADERAALTAWVSAGAPWPEVLKTDKNSKAAFWAFVAPKAASLPEVNAEWWAETPIDHFILAKLEAKGLKPAPVADRRTIIRRATFDLTGLPPTTAEIDAFLNDKQPQAFDRVVDRLLESPAYGERWGRHWLDVSRYADSNGLDENLVFANAWRYRDWVINAINEDKPIDKFIREQIAGDLIPTSGDNGLIATGFLALGAKMLAEDDPVKQELDIIDEQVDTLTKAFLGLTVGCARCHDHKFDPISAKDYYAMAGIFKSTKTMQNFKVVADWNERPIGSKKDYLRAQEIEAKIDKNNEDSKIVRKAETEKLLTLLKPLTPDYETAARQFLIMEATKAKMRPVLENPDVNIPPNSVQFEAEDLKTGNVTRDLNGYGKGIGVIHNAGTYPNFSTYEVNVAAAGSYQLDLRYASGETRPIEIFINGKLGISKAASTNTGGFYPNHQQWVAEGIVRLEAGVNAIRFESGGNFPHVDKILLVSRPGQSVTFQELVDSAGKPLLSEIVQIVAEKIKNRAPVTIELPEQADHLLAESARKRLQSVKDENIALKKSKPNVPYTMAVEEGKPTDLKVHIRGSYLTLGEPSPRRFPSVISPATPPVFPKGTSGRLELADWLTGPKNPLTARVFVNRVWRWRFGKGLVGSVDNFGVLGELPTHPELLDWLATKFITEDGWSLKKLHKRMMLTNLYLMSGKYNAAAAESDPDNRLFWRAPRRRLEAEAIRDSIWFVAGKLDRKMGGTMMSFQPREYVTGTDGVDKVDYNSPRRSVYLPVIRAAVYDVYTAFDFGDPTVMNGDRSSTTVAPQALFMLNSKVVLMATRFQAEALINRADLDDANRVRQLFVSSYGRPATDSEVTRSLEYLGKIRTIFAKSKEANLQAWQSLCKSVIAANEFIYVE